MSIFATVVDSPLEAEFGAACDSPQDFDFGFQKEREATGFANFGFDPVEAAELRGEFPEDDGDDLDDRDDYDDDTPLEDEDWEDDDLEDDRFEESYGFDEEEADKDNWE